MEFWLYKCLWENAGKMQPGAFEMQDGQAIEPMEENYTYKYLGMLQASRIDHRTIRPTPTEKFYLKH